MDPGMVNAEDIAQRRSLSEKHDSSCNHCRQLLICF
jgi:hypothetical protein